MIKNQTSFLSREEVRKIEELYRRRNALNLKEGFIKYHVDHIKPLSKGGPHKFDNLRIVTASMNLKKGSKFIDTNLF